MNTQAAAHGISSKPRLYAIPSHQVGHYWPKILPLLEKVPDYTGDKDLQKTLTDIEHGRKQLWVIDSMKAVLVTELLTTGVCLLYMVSGEGVDDWGAETIACIETWAKSKGCHKVQAVGRPGWKKVGKPYGYRLAYTTFEKDL